MSARSERRSLKLCKKADVSEVLLSFKPICFMACCLDAILKSNIRRFRWYFLGCSLLFHMSMQLYGFLVACQLTKGRFINHNQTMLKFEQSVLALVFTRLKLLTSCIGHRSRQKIGEKHSDTLKPSKSIAMLYQNLGDFLSSVLLR